MSSTTGEGALIGEECHIVARSKDGPRGSDTLPLEERDDLSNLILLCRNDHGIVDSQVEKYTVAKLTEIKKDHEQSIERAVAFYLDRELLEILSTVDMLIQKARFDYWEDVFSGIVYSTSFSMEKTHLKDLEKLNMSLFGRFRVDMFPNIENEIDIFRLILSDFICVFRKYINFEIDDKQKDRYYTHRFYKIQEYNVELYALLGKKYNFHCDLLEDLVFELTRSANRVIELITQIPFWL